MTTQNAQIKNIDAQAMHEPSMRDAGAEHFNNIDLIHEYTRSMLLMMSVYLEQAREGGCTVQAKRPHSLMHPARRCRRKMLASRLQNMTPGSNIRLRS